jgi:hypothetical protein
MGWERGVCAVAIAAAMGGLSVLGWACGGSDSGTITNSGDSGAGEGGGDDGGAYTLDDVCARTGPTICGLRKSCCEQTGGYDEQGCLAHANAECAKDVEAARGGRETFHPERIDGCIAQYQEIYKSCYVTFDLIYQALKVGSACNIFEGSLAEGAACTRTSECKPTGNANETVGCDSTTKTCKVTRFLAEGDACTIADGLPAICSQGLFCDVDLTKQPAAGTCKTATPIGTHCDSTKTFDLECGFGNYCNASGAVCTVGKAANASCQSALECQSLKCNGAGDAGPGTCGASEPLTKPEECKGP